MAGGQSLTRAAGEALNYTQRDWDELLEEWVDFSTLGILNASSCAPPGSDPVR